MDNLKVTPLLNAYSQYGGKIIDFAGWALPVQFEGIIQEHETVRNAAGIFDVSHMGEIEVKGQEAFDFLQNLVTNDLSNMEDNQVIYTLMCYEDGGVVDDLLVYRFSKDYFYLVVNASNVDKDFDWMVKNSEGYDAKLSNISESVAEVALQGPKAQEILQKLTDTNLEEIKFFYCKRDVIIDGVNCLISRTGYTGEDGFEIYTNNNDIEKLWHTIIKEGAKPIGLGARDTLRFEVNLPLYGNEISQDINPLEAGLGFFIKLGKDKFIGKDALVRYKESGLKRKLVGFELIDKGIPRHGYDVQVNGEKVGFVTTGYFAPSLKKNVGHALVDAKYSELGTEIEIVIRNKTARAVVIDKKLYKKNYKK